MNRPNQNGNERKSDIAMGHISLTSFFIGSKILKCFNGIYNWYLSISFQKWAYTSKAKSNQTKNGLILHHFYLIYKVLQHLQDFWNFFQDKVYLKNVW